MLLEFKGWAIYNYFYFYFLRFRVIVKFQGDLKLFFEGVNMWKINDQKMMELHKIQPY